MIVVDRDATDPQITLKPERRRYGKEAEVYSRRLLRSVMVMGGMGAEGGGLKIGAGENKSPGRKRNLLDFLVFWKPLYLFSPPAPPPST